MQASLARAKYGDYDREPISRTGARSILRPMQLGRGMTTGVAAAAVAAAFLILSTGAFAAGATVVTAPTSHDFGSQTVGTPSAPFTFTLTNRCYEDIANPGTCLMPGGNHPFTPSVSVTGDFAIKNNNCITLMPGDTVLGTSCTFDVVFVPSAAGSQLGVVDVGDPAGFGKAGVTGTGVPPAAAATPGALPGSAPGGKKCKKRHRSAATAKRCRKRR
jgi:hypothetical protein